MVLKHRHRLRKKDAIEILEKIKSAFGCNINGEIEIGQHEEIKVFMVNGKIHGFFLDDEPAPTVELLKTCNPQRRYVTVDDGAIKFILNGADVMTPGIIDVDHTIEKNDIVWVRDMRNLPLAVGRALIKGTEMTTTTQGKAVEIRHYIGDGLWKTVKSV